MKTIILCFHVFCFAVAVKAQSWNLTGNSGTNPALHFIGTTDAAGLTFKVNNNKSGFIAVNNYNTSFGYFSLGSVSSGNYNTAVGHRTLYSNTTGSSNTAFGYSSLNLNSSGFANTAAGDYSLRSNSTGNYNVANGYFTLLNNVNGANNVAVGAQSLRFNTAGFSNVGVGFSALYTNETGSNLVAVGDSALFKCINCFGNTGIGSKALYSNTTGMYNNAFGFQTMMQTTTGSYNIAIGKHVLQQNTTGGNNIVLGKNAMRNALAANNNIALGEDAALLGGTANVIMGNSAMSAGVASGCIAIGTKALMRTSGTLNVGIGEESLKGNDGGSRNVGVGYKTLTSSESGTYNTALGTEAGLNIGNSDRCTLLGNGADVSYSTTPLSNATAIGNGAIVTASNKIRLGNAAVTAIEGNVAYTISDGRFKQDVQELAPGIEFIKQLRPVTYRYKAYELDIHLLGDNNVKSNSLKPADYNAAERMVHTGFIAQEVNAIIKKDGYTLSMVKEPAGANDNYSLAYSELLAPLVKAVQEQQAMIELLTKELQQVKTKMTLCNCDCLPVTAGSFTK